MPYLKEDVRNIIDAELVRVMGAVEELRAPENGPILTHEAAINYVICTLFCEWFKGGYTTQAQGLGAIEAAKQEIYRRVMAPYEDAAAKRNGDIFTDGC